MTEVEHSCAFDTFLVFDLDAVGVTDSQSDALSQDHVVIVVALLAVRGCVGKGIRKALRDNDHALVVEETKPAITLEAVTGRIPGSAKLRVWLA